MVRRDLHNVANRVFAEAGLILPSGRHKTIPVDIPALAEGFGLDIVGAEPRGSLRLSPGKSAELKARDNLILVRSTILDDLGREADLREAVAHEVAHFSMHLGWLSQLQLPLGIKGRPASKSGRLAFSRSGDGDIEREAIYLGAILQVPILDAQVVLAPIVSRYRRAKWSLMSSAVNQGEEVVAAAEYRRAALEVIKSVFQTNEPTAKIALDYWNALERPPTDWPGVSKEARRTSPR